MIQQNTQRLCGSRVFNSKNCHSKIRKVAQNRFERIYLCGKHAFNYSVITENLSNNNLKEMTFPTRKEALCFFMVAIKRYD
jgi:hypothetical protein